MNQQTTLGRRIQEGRKAAGLSQEALGERLKVSRQAVSKWEADAAVPELENLIAMSRIFGVSIGQLLGVEPEEPQDQGAGALTEKELAAVEAIAAKYMAEARQHSVPQPTGSGKRLAAVLAALLLLAAGILLKHQMDSMDSRFLQLQQQVNNIESSVSGQISALSGKISNILDEKNDILSNSKAVVTEFDSSAETVTLRVTAAPKEWTDATTAVFTATLSDGRQFTAEGGGANGVFFAEGFTVPMDSAIQLSVSLMDGGSARTGMMETLRDCLPGNFCLEVRGEWLASWHSTGNQVSLSDLDLSIGSAVQPFYPVELAPTAVDLCLYRNRETEPEQVLPVPEAVSLFHQTGYTQMQNMTGYTASFALAEGDVMAVTVRVTDNFGQTSWTLLKGFQCLDGKISSLWGHGMASTDEPGWRPGDRLPFAAQ